MVLETVLPIQFFLMNKYVEMHIFICLFLKLLFKRNEKINDYGPCCVHGDGI